MFVISKIITLLLIYYCVKLGRKEVYVYNPYFLLIITLVSFLFYYPSLTFYLDELHDSTIVYILLNFFALIIGFKTSKSKNVTPITIGNKTESFWIIFIIGLMPTMIAYYMFGNVATMEGSDLLETKEKMVIPFWGQLMYLLPASILIACKRNSTKLIALSIVASLLAAILTVTKTSMVVAICFALIGFTRFKPSIISSWIGNVAKKYVWLWLPIIVVGYSYYNTTIRIEADSRDYASYVEGNVSEAEGGMIMNYLYFCSPWSNLNYDIESNPKVGYGARTFAQFLKKVGIEPIQPGVNSKFFLNTHSYLVDFYVDFRIFGSLIASFFLGWLIYFFYRKFGQSDDPLLIGYYVLIAYATSMLFFSNHFVHGYLLNYFIVMVGYSWLYRKGFKIL